jgi:hypothetical protein
MRNHRSDRRLGTLTSHAIQCHAKQPLVHSFHGDDIYGDEAIQQFLIWQPQTRKGQHRGPARVASRIPARPGHTGTPSKVASLPDSRTELAQHICAAWAV